MSDGVLLKSVMWVGSSRHDLRQFPERVRDHVGYALYVAQRGGRPRGARILQGFGGAGVLEIIREFSGDAFRAVYTVRYADAVYVLHVFQKKSRRGRETPRMDMELIERRLREAEQIAKERG